MPRLLPEWVGGVCVRPLTWGVPRSQRVPAASLSSSREARGSPHSAASGRHKGRGSAVLCAQASVRGSLWNAHYARGARGSGDAAMTRTDAGETGGRQTAVVPHTVRVGQPGGRRRITGEARLGADGRRRFLRARQVCGQRSDLKLVKERKRKNIPGRSDSMSKGPGVGRSLACSRSREKAGSPGPWR